MPRGRKPKQAFEDLPSEFQAAIDAGSVQEIKAKVAEVALSNQELLNAKEADEDLKAKTEQAKEAGAVYREGSKMNKLKIKYARLVLESRGKV